jgi:hypothetical protein
MERLPQESIIIQPEEIRRKAGNLYYSFLKAWLSDVDFFPRTIPARRTPGDESIAAASQAIQRLRDESKERCGFGYSIEWREVHSRRFGRNRFPARIFFECQEDFLRFVGKNREFASFADAVQRLRGVFPELEGWIHSNPRTLIAAATDLAGLVEVLQYLRDHPRPSVFVRELPLNVDTKFVERHKPLLREWLDLILPSHAIRADEDHFERRYGLRYVEPYLHVRLLDPQLAVQWQFPFQEIAIPLHTFGAWRFSPDVLFIVENKVNLFTMPIVKRAIGIGGLGKAVTLLRYLPWIQKLPTIYYWGDLDVEGFEILSSIRALFPQTRSLLMDVTSFEKWTSLAIPHVSGKTEVPPHLTESELAAYVRCRDNSLRIEQERFSQKAVRQAFCDFTIVDANADGTLPTATLPHADSATRGLTL